ncbi:WD40-repeat-containing domain protein [Phycomyces nitens]|nr:WD40-repeat-containing domain protein [Phycomyces nitens]
MTDDSQVTLTEGSSLTSRSHSINSRNGSRKLRSKRSCNSGRTLFSRNSITHKPLVLPRKIDFLRHLPFELGAYIVSLLDFQSLVTISYVSKTWLQHYLSKDQWRFRILERNWKLRVPPSLNVKEHQVDWYYWFKQRYQLETRWRLGKVSAHYLDGHLQGVYCVQFDDQKIVTGSRDTTIKIWDARSYQCIRTLRGHEASVLCLNYDDRTMVSGSSDTTLIVWNIQSLDQRMRLRGHTAGISGVCFDDRCIISSSKDNTIRIWNFADGVPIRVITGHSGPVNSIQLKGNHLVSVSGDGLIKLWNILNGNCIRGFSGHTGGLTCVQFDGRRIVSGASDHTIKVWDAEVNISIYIEPFGSILTHS